jgi:hypothetical protein
MVNRAQYVSDILHSAAPIAAPRGVGRSGIPQSPTHTYLEGPLSDSPRWMPPLRFAASPTLMPYRLGHNVERRALSVPEPSAEGYARRCLDLRGPTRKQ